MALLAGIVWSVLINGAIWVAHDGFTWRSWWNYQHFANPTAALALVLATRYVLFTVAHKDTHVRQDDGPQRSVKALPVHQPAREILAALALSFVMRTYRALGEYLYLVIGLAIGSLVTPYAGIELKYLPWFGLWLGLLVWLSLVLAYTLAVSGLSAVFLTLALPRLRKLDSSVVAIVMFLPAFAVAAMLFLTFGYRRMNDGAALMYYAGMGLHLAVWSTLILLFWISIASSKFARR